MPSSALSRAVPECGQDSMSDHSRCLWRDRAYAAQALVPRIAHLEHWTRHLGMRLAGRASRDRLVLSAERDPWRKVRLQPNLTNRALASRNIYDSPMSQGRCSSHEKSRSKI